jgi:hypothetical protein
VLPASAAAAPVVETFSVERSATVAAGATRTLTLTCPGTSVAVGGAAPSGLAALRASVPLSDAQRWRFRFAAGGARQVTAALRCVGLNVPAGIGRVSLEVSSRFEPDLEVAPGATRRIALACAAGQLPTGWGFERAERSLEVAAALPTRTGWTFEFENAGRAAATVTPRIRCLQREQRARDGRAHAFAMRRVSFAARGGEVTRSCLRDEAGLATGFSLDPAGGLEARVAAPSGERGGRWSFGPGSARVEPVLLCLSRTTRFR